MTKNRFYSKKWSDEKSRRFAFFLDRFWRNLSKSGSIGIYRKSGPTKSTVLGPGPPPGRKHKIYWNLSIFHVFRAFNRAGKTVTKVGIYALPPLGRSQKWSKSDILAKKPILSKIYRDSIDQTKLFYARRW
jgi:hypothetical protein